MGSMIIRRSQGHIVTIMCPKCKKEPMHYLMALVTGGVWTLAPGQRIGKNDALALNREMMGAEADRFQIDRYGITQTSEINGRNQTVKVECQRCKNQRRVRLETLKIAAHNAWANEWDRLTFDANDTLVNFDKPK